MCPIGTIHTNATNIPKFWAISDVEGELVIDEELMDGLKDIESGQRIMVIFYFHKSSNFTRESLTQYPRGNTNRPKKGVFSIRSPIRPNPIGLSILMVTDIKDNVMRVKGLDMYDGTPVLDIKPLSNHLNDY